METDTYEGVIHMESYEEMKNILERWRRTTRFEIDDWRVLVENDIRTMYPEKADELLDWLEFLLLGLITGTTKIKRRGFQERLEAFYRGELPFSCVVVL